MSEQMSVLRCFVKAFTDGDVSSFPLNVKQNWKVSELKAKILQLQSKDRDSLSANAGSYSLVFGKNGVLLPDDFSCDVLHSDDFLILCPKGKENQFSEASPENIGTSYFDLCELSATGDQIVQLDGETLTCEDLMMIGMGRARVELLPDIEEKIQKSRDVVNKAVENKEIVYGVSTGFGCFKNKVIEPNDICKLQENLITSHATGVGKPLSTMRTRMLFALRINVIIKGYSGVRLEIIQSMIETLNAGCLPYIPEKGSVGASGDLAPLSHLILGLMGQGQMWSAKTGWGPALEVLKANGRTPIQLEAKEGLALNNGTQMITALGAEAMFRAEMIAKQVEIVAALTIEVLKGVPEQYAQDVHECRPHVGQGLVATRLRKLLYNEDGSVSSLIGSRQQQEADDVTKGKKVQDPYSLRCIPQVHGIVHETLAFVKNVIKTELNSATDNPLIMIDRDIPGTASAGHFHGEYPGKAMDYLAVAIHELASISERRIERLVHPDYIAELGLPGFLVGGKEGLNNGFMISHYTAAALVSEDKVLTHPSTVDSITTSGGSEDHVSMGTYAARKALTVVEHVENVIAIELLAACQALDCHNRASHDQNPNLSPTQPLQKVYELVRKHVKTLEEDRFMSPDIVVVTRLLQEGQIWDVVRHEVPSFPTGLFAELKLC